MFCENEEKIASLTAAGLWGTETLHGLLINNAQKHPNALAVKDQPNREELTGHAPLTLDWAGLEVASENVAVALQDKGVGAGDVVLVQLPNVVELLVVYYAMSKIGAVVSPVPVQYGRHELQSLKAALGARTMLTLERLRDVQLTQNASDALPQIQHLAFGRDILLETKTIERPCERPEENANRILSICWTSGTTGTPKGVPRSHNMWMATGRCTAGAGGMVAGDVLLNPFPLVNMASIGGFVFPAALLGCGIVLHHPLDPPLYLQQMQDERVTFTIAPPALLNQLAKNSPMWEQFDFSALRRIGSGSAPLAPWMIETFSRDYGKEIVNFYGSNEGIALFSTPETAPSAEVRATMFPRPQSGAVITTKVVNPDTGEEEMQVGGSGELVISGATVFDGYFSNDSSTDSSTDDVSVFTADGFFRSGDLVEICGDAGQYYRIVGRCKDIINRGGVKISPQELDVVLEEHPDVLEGAVCAYADERLGEKICACLVLAPDITSVELNDLQQYFLEKGFAKFKLPERIEYFAQMPRNPLGKVQRFSLQKSVAQRS